MPKQQQNDDDDRSKKLDLVLNEPQRKRPIDDWTASARKKNKFGSTSKRIVNILLRLSGEPELVVAAAEVSLRREDDEGRLPAL